MSVFMVTRREFLHSALASSALVLAADWRALAAEPDAAATPDPSLFIAIAPDGTVRLVAHRSEMGNGSRTALPRVLADELDADWNRVVIEQAIGDARLGSQDTDGSTSIRLFFATLREVGATARLMLVRAAAERWQARVIDCRTEAHEVVHRLSGRRLGYGELAADAARLPVPPKTELSLKPRAAWRYIGKDAPSYDLQALCSGQAKFGMDAYADDMAYASIARPPVLGAKLRSFDDTATLRVPGVRQTVTLEIASGTPGFQPKGGVAVIADNTWAAIRGRQKLALSWDPGPEGHYSSAAEKQELRQTARQAGAVVREVGDVDAAFARGGRVVESEYFVPMLAHAPMEPPVALADFRNGKVEAWVSTQNPQAVQAIVAKTLGIAKEDVVCHVPLLGGGFGRKSFPDYAAEAALLSKKVGRPVKVVWTREDDIQHDYYLPAAAMYFKAALDDRGWPAAWLQRSAFPSIDSTFDPQAARGAPWELSRGFIDLPFRLAHHRVESGPARPHVRLGWLRSVSNVYHLFGVYSFIDELARAGSRDAVEFLLDLIGPARVVPRDEFPKEYRNEDAPYEHYPVDTGRLRRVIELAAEKAGWGKTPSGRGIGMGVAAHRTILTYVAVVAKVEIDSAGALQILQLDTAVDAGTLVNPENVRAQFQGAAVYGTSILRSGAITAREGAILQSNFHDYPVARIDEAPRRTNVHLVDSDAPPAGLGEAGVPLVIPAICNAICAATGVRVRELPLGSQRLRS
jgi:isoquinoline 1-oxidoreductase beta subunit